MMNLSKLFTAVTVGILLLAAACTDVDSTSTTVKATNGTGSGNAYITSVSTDSISLLDSKGKPVNDPNMLQAFLAAGGEALKADPTKSFDIPGCKGCHMGSFTTTTYPWVTIDFKDTKGNTLETKRYNPPEGFDPNTPAGAAWLQKQVDDYFKTTSTTKTPMPTPTPTPDVTSTIKDTISQSVIDSVQKSGSTGGGYSPPR